MNTRQNVFLTPCPKCGQRECSSSIHEQQLPISDDFTGEDFNVSQLSNEEYWEIMGDMPDGAAAASMQDAKEEDGAAAEEKDPDWEMIDEHEAANDYMALQALALISQATIAAQNVDWDLQKDNSCQFIACASLAANVVTFSTNVGKFKEKMGE
jgi:hypothetical protein